jgi:hypothetical protein
VIAMQDATDGFDPNNPNVPGILYKNIDTFTGQCSPVVPGETASTQGNSTLIPTPTPLTSCADAVCGVPPVPNPPIP